MQMSTLSIIGIILALLCAFSWMCCCCNIGDFANRRVANNDAVQIENNYENSNVIDVISVK